MARRGRRPATPAAAPADTRTAGAPGRCGSASAPTVRSHPAASSGIQPQRQAAAPGVGGRPVRADHRDPAEVGPLLGPLHHALAVVGAAQSITSGPNPGSRCTASGVADSRGAATASAAPWPSISTPASTCSSAGRIRLPPAAPAGQQQPAVGVGDHQRHHHRRHPLPRPELAAQQFTLAQHRVAVHPAGPDAGPEAERMRCGAGVSLADRRRPRWSSRPAGPARAGRAPGPAPGRPGRPGPASTSRAVAVPANASRSLPRTQIDARVRTGPVRRGVRAPGRRPCPPRTVPRRRPRTAATSVPPPPAGGQGLGAVVADSRPACRPGPRGAAVHRRPRCAGRRCRPGGCTPRPRRRAPWPAAMSGSSSACSSGNGAPAMRQIPCRADDLGTRAGAPNGGVSSATPAGVPGTATLGPPIAYGTATLAEGHLDRPGRRGHGAVQPGHRDEEVQAGDLPVRGVVARWRSRRRRAR